MPLNLTEHAGVIRAWCEGLTATMFCQNITPQGRPYLERYFVTGWSPINKQPRGAIYFHHFVASDPDDLVHSHPWGWSASLILVGGYREERCNVDGLRSAHVYRPGDVNVLDPDDKHRIELLSVDCWSLFLAGDFLKPWDFAPMCR